MLKVESQASIEAVSESNKRSFKRETFEQGDYVWFKSYPVELLRLANKGYETKKWHKFVNTPLNLIKVSHFLGKVTLASTVSIMVLSFTPYMQLGSLPYLLGSSLLVFFSMKYVQESSSIEFIRRYAKLKDYIQGELGVPEFDARLRYEEPHKVVMRQAAEIFKAYQERPEWNHDMVYYQGKTHYALRRLASEFISQNVGFYKTASERDYEFEKLLKRNNISNKAIKESEAFAELKEEFKEKRIANLDDDEDLAITFFMPEIQGSAYSNHSAMKMISLVGVILGLVFLGINIYGFSFGEEGTFDAIAPVVAILCAMFSASLITFNDGSKCAVDFNKEMKRIKRSIKTSHHRYDLFD